MYFEIEHHFSCNSKHKSILDHYHSLNLNMMERMEEDTVGSITAYFFRPHHLAFDVLDEWDELHPDAYDELERMVEEKNPLNVIYISRMSIEKLEERAKGLGTQMLQHFIEHCCSHFRYSLIFLQSSPLYYGEEGNTPKGYAKLQKKLNNFYKKNGFEVREVGEKYVGSLEFE